jgi:signal transduction histidine kinase
MIVTILNSMLIVIGFWISERIFSKLTDRVFFKYKKNHLDSLNHFSKEGMNLIDLKKVLSIFKKDIESHLRLTSIEYISSNDILLNDLNPGQAIYYDEITYKLLMDKSNKKLIELFSLFKHRKLEGVVLFPQPYFELYGLMLKQKQSQDMFNKDEKDYINLMISQLLTIFKKIEFYNENLENEKRILDFKKAAELGDLARGLAHEIKNPLMSLKSYFLLSNGLSPVERENFGNIAIGELRRIESLLNQLKSFQFVKESSFQKVDIIDLTENIIIFLSKEAKIKNINLEKDHPKENIFVSGDENQLKQVFLNLILNALEACESGHTVKIIVDLQKKKEVRVRIQDNGPGIASEDLDKIFEPFFTKKQSGTGLGLSIVKNIILSHKGKIEVQSSLGLGTTFTLFLPLNQN